MSAVQPYIDPSPADGQLLARLYDEHSRDVLGLCRFLLRDRDEAEDAMQQAFLSAHKALLRGTRPRDPAAWIAAIARNECRGRIRQRMAEPRHDELDHDVAGHAATDEIVQRNAQVRELRAALHELPERQRHALVLREFHGLRQEELAAELGVEEATVESLLWRARRRVAQAAGGLGALFPFPSLGEALARVAAALRGSEPAAAALGAGGSAAGISVGVKVAAATVAVVTATSVAADDGRVRAKQRQEAATPTAGQRLGERPVQASGPTMRAVVEPRDRSGPSESSRSGNSDSSGSGTSGSSGSDNSGTSGSGSSNLSGSGSSGSGSSGTSGSGSSGSDSSGTSGSGSSGTSGTSGSSDSGTSGLSGSGSSGSSGSGSSGSSDSATSGSSGSGSSGSGSSGSGSSGSSGSGSSGDDGSDSSGSGS